jgi:hypothetical protein
MLKVGDAVFFRPNRDYHTDVTDRCIVMGAVSRTQDILLLFVVHGAFNTLVKAPTGSRVLLAFLRIMSFVLRL